LSVAENPPRGRDIRKPQKAEEEAMAILNRLAQIAVKPFPRMISPKGHAIFDYVNLGIFLLGAGAFWPRNKRAAVAALIAGGAALATDLVTDYPGGLLRVIPFSVHRDIDFGLAAMTAAMPGFLFFGDDHEKGFFLAEGALISAVSELTEIPQPARARRRSERAKAA
jgi:hypothetical protein